MEQFSQYVLQLLDVPCNALGSKHDLRSPIRDAYARLAFDREKLAQDVFSVWGRGEGCTLLLIIAKNSGHIVKCFIKEQI